MATIKKYAVLLIILACILSRTPQLFSGAQILDGDEAIVGLMAKHLGHNGEFPAYFWGQTYGLSIIEVSTIALFYVIFGYGAFSMHLAMLFLWTLALVCFYKLMRNIRPEGNFLIPLLICFVFIFNPAFAIWSLKARGGYISAFLLSQLFLLLLFKSKTDDQYIPVFLGLLCILLFESQSLWMAGLMPYLAFVILKRWKKIQSLSFILSSCVFFILFKLYKSTLVSFWEPEIFPLRLRDWQGILDLPKEILAHFSGSFIYSSYLEPSLFAEISSWLFLSLFMLLFVWGIRKVVAMKFQVSLELAAVISLPLAISYMLLIPGIHPRYLLPLIGYVLFALSILSENLENKSWFKLSLLAYLPIGAIALTSYTHFSYEKAEPFNTLLLELKEKKIEAIFSESGLLQWQVMYYSDEKIKARYRNKTDRYPAYVEQANSIYQSRPEATAIIGHLNDYHAPKEGDFLTIANTYFLFINPSDSLLKARGFEFEEPSSQ